VSENRRPAKFRIAATIATQLDPSASSEDALWVELDRLTPIFLARWEAIRAGASLPQPADGPSLLELCRELAARTLAAMAWTLRQEGCHNVNWVGGEVVIHLHAIVD
jgi:putative pyruvate formate lyase activating enzyme